MTNELVKILEAAKKAYKSSMSYFELFAIEPDKELREIYWTRTQEFDGRCAGLLQAYEILTGKHIYQHQIDEELALA